MYDKFYLGSIASDHICLIEMEQGYSLYLALIKSIQRYKQFIKIVPNRW